MDKSVIYLLLKTARPRQWIKNLSLYAALFFSGFLFVTVDGNNYFYTVTIAFIIFCFLTSSVYIINDIIDQKADRNHPFKRKRPIASGELSVPIALFGAIILLLAVFFLSIWLSLFFKLLIVLYLMLQIAYGLYFKHVPILDISAIATGFLIRVYAGAVVVNLHMNVWFLLTVISASLFLAVGKRQSERTLLMGKDDSIIGNTRKILKRYSQRLLDQFTAMFATATWLTYALFTFQDQSGGQSASELASVYTFLPRTLHSQKLLMLSLPFVIFGVMRYLQLIYESNEGESPERVLLGDRPLLTTVFLFTIIVFVVMYLLG
ncbi:decaprenyl-phosphate phosphoribosyltransferase [Candidatus Woesebacteria bacterium]|nr:decaprenyl-phosphate phosphoribosyltransferase [Candidatus Woesebacteria bacterium]